MSVEEALAALRDGGDDAKVLAGGQSLVPLLNLRLARPSLLVDLGALPAADIELVDGTLTMGCMVRHTTLLTDPAVRQVAPLLPRCAAQIGHPAIRHRGTLGGSVSHADPTAELVLVSLVLDAEYVIRSVDAERTVASADFFQGPFMTDLEVDEILWQVRIPAAQSNQSFGFRELAPRVGDFAMAAAAARIDVDQDGRVQAARVAVAGASPTAQRLTAVEGGLLGRLPGSIDVMELAVAGIAPLSFANDSHGTPEFRRELLRSVLHEVLAEVSSEGGPA